MSRTLRWLWNEPDFPRLRTAFMLALSGLAGGGLLVAIGQAAGPSPGLEGRLQAAFVALVLLALSLLSLRDALVQIAGAEAEALLRLRLRLGDRLRRADCRRLESLGAPAIYTSLARDGEALRDAAPGLALLFRAGLVTLVGFGYLGGLSLLALLAAAGVVGAATLFAGAVIRPRVDRDLQESRGPEWAWYAGLQQLLAGFPELRLNRLRHDRLFDRYARAAADSSILRRNLGETVADARVSGWGALLALILGFGLWMPESAGFGMAAAILYLSVELAPAPGWFTHVLRADDLLAEWFALEAALRPDPDPPPSFSSEPRRFQGIGLERAVFRYGEGSGAFVLGPLSLRLDAGEILYLTGAAGSGKTTLLKLIGGLYRPAAGSLVIDGEPLEGDAGDAYRDLFSGVLAGRPNPGSPPGWRGANPETVLGWLERLDLAGKVAWSGEGFSHGPLSTGELRRLALATAVLEDKPVLLLDEEGMDSDPAFLEHCWPGVLAELRRRGTAVVAVVRDIRRPPPADRVWVLDRGRPVETP